MEQIINRFNKGLNKDINKINFPNDTYYHLQNGRILSDKGNTNFSISNIEGNSLFSSDIQSLYPGFVIIGYVNVRNDIVFFLADENNTGKGKIILYKLGVSVNIITLYENDNLNFYPGFPIYQDGVTSRYETPEVIKIYWTDNYNNLRFLNIAPNKDTTGYIQEHYTDVQSTPLNNLDLISEVNFNTPSFVSFTSGSLNSGMIQYAYRLYNINGGETIFSPASELIPLTKYSESQGTERLRGQSTGGQALDTNTSKGVIININLDSDLVSSFDKIEVISLWYSDKEGLPNISIIDRKDVSTNINVIDEGGVAEYGTLELEEYRNLAYDFKCKTLAVKDNKLFVANITEEYFDVDYDARAYRYFNTLNQSIGRLYSNNGNTRLLKTQFVDEWIEAALDSGQDAYTGSYTVTGNTYTTETIPSEFDCVNMYNLLDYEASISPLVYQLDGTTLGGEGVNVSYEFEETNYAISNDIQNADGIVDMNIPITQDNIRWIRGSYKTFQRDEIYRFGIVFFDKKGRSSFVKWIGDIRMPSIADIPLTVNNNDIIYAVAINPKFTITSIPAIDGEILDYQIVYVKREKEDKTIISQGVGGSVIADADPNYDCPIRITPISDYIDETPSLGGAVLSTTILEYISPDINFDKTFTIPFDKIDLVGALYCEGHSQRADDVTGFLYSTDYSTGFDSDYDYFSIKKYNQNISLPKIGMKDILDGYILIPSIEDTGSITISSKIVKHYVLRHFSSLGGKKGTSALIEIDSKIADTGSYFGLNALADNSIFLLNIKNNVIGYGGNTYEDRLLNAYIPASDINGTICYNGDTFICMYDYLRSMYDTSRGANDKYVEIIYFPIETPYNLFYRYDDSFSRIYNYGEGASQSDYPFRIEETGFTELSVGIDWSDLYLYDDVYSKIDTSKIYLPKPDEYSDNKVFDNIIKYSNTKLNGEERDSWIQFKPNNFNETNANYGQINSLVEFNDNIFVFQEGAISIAAINKQSLITDSVGTELSLGKGDILDRFDYITTEIGIQGLNKVVKSLQALYWLDLNKKKIYTFSRGIESLDDLKGLNSWFEYGLSENTVMTGIYDNKYTEVLFTIKNIIRNVIEEEVFSKPSCTIGFTNVIDGSQIFLTLNDITYPFVARTEDNTGQFFKIEAALSDTIDNFIDAVERFVGGNYSVTKDGTNVTITGLVDGLSNLSPRVIASSITKPSPGDSVAGGVGITIEDYSDKIVSPNSIFFVDCTAQAIPDKFEILVNGSVVASSHISDVRVLNGSISNFDPTLDSEPADIRTEWYIGTNNGVCPTGIEEFHTDVSLDPNEIPLTNGYQQRIWYKGINPGDTVELKVRGETSTTRWVRQSFILSSSVGNIDVLSVSNIEKSISTTVTLEEASILDTTSNGNILNVEDIEYFNLRLNNTYNIDGTDNVKIEGVTSSSFITDKEFVGDVNLEPYAKYNDNFTVAYNEAIQGFTGFYDFKPTLYIKYNKGFFTTIDNKSIWKHNDGEYCNFYGTEYYPTYIDIIAANNSTMIKEYNNIEYYSEVYKNGQLVPNQTLYSIQVENDYQQSEEVILYPLSDDEDIKELRALGKDYRKSLYTEGNNIPTSSSNFNNLANVRRVIDHWRTNVPRVVVIDERTTVGDYDAEDYDNDDYYVFSNGTDQGLNRYDRIRSPYYKVRLKFVNEEDKKLLLHQVTSLLQPMIV